MMFIQFYFPIRIIDFILSLTCWESKQKLDFNLSKNNKFISLLYWFEKAFSSSSEEKKFLLNNYVMEKFFN